jgi:hypothetical protein
MLRTVLILSLLHLFWEKKEAYEITLLSVCVPLIIFRLMSTVLSMYPPPNFCYEAYEITLMFVVSPIFFSFFYAVRAVLMESR